MLNANHDQIEALRRFRQRMLEQRDKHQEQAQAMNDELARMVRDALAAGESVSAVARALRTGRTRVYQLRDEALRGTA